MASRQIVVAESGLMPGTGAKPIKALARLGRRDQERKALKRFLGRYPNSVYAPSARARLNRLSQRQP